MVLTNKDLGFIPKKTNWWGGKRKLTGIGEYKSIPLSMVTGVVVERTRKRHTWHLNFKEPGLNFTLANVDGGADPAAGFMQELERVGLASQSSLADEVDKLGRLLDEGVITEGEFAKAKEVYLGRSPDKKESGIIQLQQLYSLFRSGALSESEFRTKKWDILSRS